MASGFVVNVRALNRRLSGVERYATEITNRYTGHLRLVGPGRVTAPSLGHLWEQFVLPTRLAKGELLWSPANIGPLAVTNQVLTLHDISVLEHPEWFQPLFARWYRSVLPVLVRRVRRVLTVSEYSRQRILKMLGVSPEKVIAIPGGVDLQRFRPSSDAEVERVCRRYNLAGDYLLFVGTLEPRKNLSFLLEVWGLIHPEFPHMELAIAGGSVPHFATLPPIPDSPGVHFLGYVPERDLSALYSGALVFLLPSLEEGFGLTALEAMACGTPVIASNAGALPETLGIAGMLIDPRETLSWADALYRLLIDKGYWQEFWRLGLERACQYSWERTASRVWQALENEKGNQDD